MTIWERVKTALTGLGLPLAANVQLAATGADLPDAYLVYFVIAAQGAQYADDAEKSRASHVQVTYFSRAGLAGLPAIAAAMTAAGFTRGPERELPYDELTRHFALSMEFYYLEKE